ncbi:MAG: GNAT family N-acetyltransferase [Ardenticatenales bacterium]|nr:GNAT family N-acetyltransferase [Ardenticatenales bacterium]
MLEKPVLYGEIITLRPIVKEDAPGMFAALDDVESMRLTGTQASFTFEQVEAFCARLFDDPDRVDYAITLKDDPAYIGEVVLNDIDWENRSASFRIALGSSRYFGKGYGSEATRLLIDYGFRELKLHRIELEVYDFNPRAQHVYEKAGFMREGVRRDVLLWDGDYHSAIVMSILAPEYEARLVPME